jgi:hypothetical protein
VSSDVVGNMLRFGDQTMFDVLSLLEIVALNSILLPHRM